MKDFIRILRYKLLQGWFNVISSEIKLNGKILLVAPHPDDEVFGCGGLLFRLMKEDRDVEVFIVSDGSASHTNCCNVSQQEVASNRKKHAMEVPRILGLPTDKLHFLDLPDGSIPSNYRLALPYEPDVILIPHWGEGWPDHLSVRQIGLRLASPQTQVYEYCVWMWYYNVWHLFSQKPYVLKMSKEEHSAKLRAIAAYTEPKAPCGKPWSGVLPRSFIRANSSNTEVYFLCKREKR